MIALLHVQVGTVGLASIRCYVETNFNVCINASMESVTSGDV